MKWPQASLGDICLLGPQYGANAPAIERSGNRSRYVRITDITANGRLLSKGEVEADLADETEFKLHEGDLLFAGSGNTVGKTYCYDPEDGPCVFAGYLIRFRLNEELMHRRFAFYFTQSAPYQNWLVTKRRVAGQPNVNGKEYASLKVPLPPLSEQRQIVELLEQADALRRCRAGADSLSARILPAVFQEMFGDPVTNPKGWPTQPLARIVTFVSGATPSKERTDYWDGSVPWVSAKDMKRLEIRDAIDHISEIALRETNIKLINPGAVLIVVRGMILAHTVPIALNRAPLTINQDLKALVPTGEVPTEFLQWVLLSQHQNLLRLVSTAAHGTRKLDTEALTSLQIPVPTALLERFAIHAKEQSRASEHRRIAADNIETLFQTLLHRAFTGELTAGWREAHMKELIAEMEIQARHLASAQA